MRAVPMLAAYSCALLAGSPTLLAGQAGATQRAGVPSPVYLIIRTDDAGFSHSANVALQRLIDTGLPVSVSVMFAGAVKARNVLPITYRDLIAKQGLTAMRRPAG